MHIAGTTSLANSTADRVIDILLLFSDQKPVWTAVELAQKMDMPRSTVYRYLSSLKNSRLIVEQGDGLFKLGPRVQVLANVAKSSTNFIQIAREEMLKLSERFNETVLLNELVDYDIATLERIESRHRIRLMSTRGSLLPWPATPSSKLFLAYATPEKREQFWSISSPQAYTALTIIDKTALLAELAKIVREGYAYSDEERDEGVLGVAVPIIAGNDCQYCLSIVAPKFRVNATTLDEMRQALISTAHVIAKHGTD
jgi:DNA-binding IclR family transcriptional regulator